LFQLCVFVAKSFVWKNLFFYVRIRFLKKFRYPWQNLIYFAFFMLYSSNYVLKKCFLVQLREISFLLAKFFSLGKTL
jgi:hypothetical protein